MSPAPTPDDLRRAAGLLAGARRIAVLTGAGVSAESGIPTFRGAGDLWRGRDPMALATPEAFRADPALVWEFYRYRRDLVARAAPNPAHRALARLADRVGTLTLVTQNVDRLHQRAGSRDVVELHGNLDEVRCSACDRVEDRAGETPPPLPRCEGCGALQRPAVVWFGEPLPPGAWRRAEAAVAAADLVLVVGTSAVVYPAASLIHAAGGLGRAVIEINLEPTPASPRVDLGLYGPAGTILPGLIP